MIAQMFKTTAALLIGLLLSVCSFGAIQDANRLAQPDRQMQAALDATKAIADQFPEASGLYEALQPSILALGGKFQEAIELVEKQPNDELKAISLSMLSAKFARAKKIEQTRLLLQQAENLSTTIENAKLDREIKRRYYASLAASHHFLGNTKRYAELLTQHKKAYRFSELLCEELILQNSFEAARSLAGESQLLNRRASQIDLAEANHIALQNGEEAALTAYLAIVRQQANLRLNSPPLKTNPFSLSAKPESIIQAAYWLATHGHTEKLGEIWPEFPKHDTFGNRCIGVAARLLADDGKAGAKLGVKLLKTCDMMDLRPDVFFEAGMQEDYDQAEIAFWRQRLNESGVATDELKRAAKALERLGNVELMRKAISKIPDQTIDLAVILAAAGDTQRAVAMADELYEAKKGSEEIRYFSFTAGRSIVRAYQAKKLSEAGKTEAATALFDECLNIYGAYPKSDYRDRNSDLRSAWNQILAIKIDSGDLDGTLSYIKQNPDWANLGGHETWSLLVHALAKANRVDEAVALAKSKFHRLGKNAFRPVFRGLIAGKHWQEAIPYLNPEMFIRRRKLNTSFFNSHKHLEIVEDLAFWKYSHEIAPSSIGYPILTHAAKNFDNQKLSELIKAADGIGFRSLARLMRQADRDAALLKLTRTMADNVTAESKPELVFELLFVLGQLNQEQKAFEIGRKYIESQPADIEVMSNGKAARIGRNRKTFWSESGASLLLQQYSLLAEKLDQSVKAKKFPESIQKLSATVENGTANYRVQTFLKPKTAQPVSAVRLKIARIDNFLNSPKGQTYRRGHHKER